MEEGEPEQLSIFDIEFVQEPGKAPEEKASEKKREKLDKALDAIRKKYGEKAVVRGSFLEL